MEEFEIKFYCHECGALNIAGQELTEAEIQEYVITCAHCSDGVYNLQIKFTANV